MVSLVSGSPHIFSPKTTIETLNRIREVLNISDEDIVKILKEQKGIHRK